MEKNKYEKNIWNDFAFWTPDENMWTVNTSLKACIVLSVAKELHHLPEPLVYCGANDSSMAHLRGL